MKDFYDVWLLASTFPFEGSLLAKAIGATFSNRETAIDVAPIAFTSEFTEQLSTQTQWTAGPLDRDSLRSPAPGRTELERDAKRLVAHRADMPILAGNAGILPLLASA